jgi:copper chaperone CopZ
MIRKTVRKIPGVESVAIDLDKGLVEVKGDTTVARRAAVAEAIERMGYDVVESDSVKGMKADSTQNSIR